jgi:hypothetical protein
MGDLQTYFYLALISGVMIGLSLVCMAVVVAGLRRWLRQAPNLPPLTFWLVAGAVTVTLLFIVVGSAGVLYGFLRYGAS